MSDPNQHLDDLWEQVREDLRGSVSAASFEAWIEPVSVIGLRDGALYLKGTDRVRDWFNRRYAPMALAALSRHAEGIARIVFTDEEPEPDDPGPSADPGLPAGIDGEHDFDRFIIGPGNRLAHSAALAVAESPGEAYNPLFIHGAPGLGKTHLLASIAGYIRSSRPDLGVVYTTAERFTAEFVSSLRAKNGAAEFKRRHRNCGVLLVDDVQFLEDKPKTEEEFFHTFNELYTSGSQLVLSSDRPPEAMASLTERLRDRFAWGLTVGVHEPDERTRIALLRKLAAARGGGVPGDEVLERIAAISDGNLRRLEGALTRVQAIASMLGEQPTPEMVDEALAAGSAIPAAEQELTIDRIQSVTGDVLKIGRADLLGRRRSPNLVRARQLAMFVARKHTGASLAEIARAFDRDHSTVLHAIRTVERRLEPGSDIHRALEAIHTALHLPAPVDRG